MNAPRISIVIPTYNRCGVLKRCLEAFAAQSCHDFEVLVGDDGSKDDTSKVARAANEAGPMPVRYLHQKNSGANAARNRAIESARGGLILLINDDTIPVPEFVAEHLAAHETFPQENVAVLGRVTADPLLPYSPLAKLHLDRAFAALEGKPEADWRAFFTCNVSAKRSLLEKAGLFEEGIRYHEDLELSERLSHFGLRVIYRPKALGFHDHLLTEREFLQVAEREAKALVFWARKSPHLSPLLAEFGYEPDCTGIRRWKRAVADAVFHRRATPWWSAFARMAAPVAEPVALSVYLRLYQTIKRAAIERQLQEQAV